MRVITGRNVNLILPEAIRLMHEIGIERDSRNGPVMQSPVPVSTVYENPTERVVFYPERDANPFFHLYESLWMLMGRNDLAGPQRYVKTFGQFSDDGVTLHGAYGYRWRQAFGYMVEIDHGGQRLEWESFDQLNTIAEQLKKNPNDRRCVLQMWDARLDLGKTGKDLPCNDTATFQIGTDGRLHLVVFCRSNDIIWGAYGANAVHFSFLLEYMANWIGVPVGTYTQVSVNWHMYLATSQKVEVLADRSIENLLFADPYTQGAVTPSLIRGPIQLVDDFISSIVEDADRGFPTTKSYSEPWAQTFYTVLHAHHVWKTQGKNAALELLARHDVTDWTLAAGQWLKRRNK